MVKASTVLELAGMGLISWAAWMAAPWLGLLIGGVFLLTAGVSLDTPKKGRTR